MQVSSDDAARAYDNERPQHVVELKAYWLDPAPVTAAQFAEYIAATGAPALLGFAEQPPEAPVTKATFPVRSIHGSTVLQYYGGVMPTMNKWEEAEVTQCPNPHTSSESAGTRSSMRSQ